MDGVGLGDNVLHAAAGIETGRGVLKNHLRLRAEIPELFLRQLGDIRAVEDDFAVRHVVEPQQRLAEGGLPAAGLADKAEGLAAPDFEVHAVDGVERFLFAALVFDREVFLETLGAEDDVVFIHTFSTPFA